VGTKRQLEGQGRGWDARNVSWERLAQRTTKVICVSIYAADGVKKGAQLVSIFNGGGATMRGEPVG